MKIAAARDRESATQPLIVAQLPQDPSSPAPSVSHLRRAGRSKSAHLSYENPTRKGCDQNQRAVTGSGLARGSCSAACGGGGVTGGTDQSSIFLINIYKENTKLKI